MLGYTFNELVERKQKQIYRNGTALADDLLARICVVQDILEGFSDEEEALERASDLEKTGNILFTKEGFQFSYEEIRRAIKSRAAIKFELSKLINMIEIWSRE